MAMKLIIRIILVAATVFILPYIIAGITVTGWKAALIVSVALAIVNLLIKPIISLILLPLNIVTLGLVGLVVNGAILYFMPMMPFVTEFAVATFWAGFLGALVIEASDNSTVNYGANQNITAHTVCKKSDE